MNGWKHASRHEVTWIYSVYLTPHDSCILPFTLIIKVLEDNITGISRILWVNISFLYTSDFLMKIGGKWWINKDANIPMLSESLSDRGRF